MSIILRVWESFYMISFHVLTEKKNTRRVYPNSWHSQFLTYFQISYCHIFKGYYVLVVYANVFKKIVLEDYQTFFHVCSLVFRNIF